LQTLASLMALCSLAAFERQNVDDFRHRGQKRTVHRWAHNAILDPLFKFAEPYGVTASEICEAVGLDIHQATAAGALVPAAQIVDAMEWSARRSGRDDFGLQFGASVNYRIIGLPALLGERTRSVAECFEVLKRNLPLHNGAISFAFATTPTGGVVRYLIHSKGQFPPVQYAEASLALAVNWLRRFIGGGWNPVLVSFAHPRGADLSDYQRVFQAPVAFEADRNAIHFSAEDLAWRSPAASLALQQRLDADVQNLALIEEHDIVRRVGEIIRALLPGQVSLDGVAGELGMTARTLQRRLTDEGTRFTTLVKSARVALANEYLRHPGVTVADAAERLGFSHASELSRLLRSELGVSPGELKVQRSPRRQRG
jgi:AraC-like DNA-binding protein